MTLGSIIKQYRDENHISMDAVAQQCGITKGYVAMLEKNINPKNNKPLKPSIETIVKVCDGLHLDIDYIFSQLDDDYIVHVPALAHSEEVTKKDAEIIELVELLQTLTSENIHRVVEYAEFIAHKEK